MAHAAGIVTSIQETVGSEIAYAAILHLAQSTPVHLLRYAWDCSAIVDTSTAQIVVHNGDNGVRASSDPGLGVIVDRDILGKPIATYGMVASQ